MLISHVLYHLKGAFQKEFMAEIEALHIREDTLAEEGNLCYSFFLPVGNAEAIFLLERWKDEEALALHKTRKAFFDLQDVKGRYVSSVEAKIFKSE